MATGRVQDICAMMKRFIDLMKKEIQRKENRIEQQRERLHALVSQRNPDAGLVHQINEDISRMERELVDDRGQLNAMEEEFSAACGGS